jgi:hypothetical protein
MTHPIETREPIAHGPAATVPHRGLDLPAAVAISWSLAGGMLLGGAAVVAMIVTNQMSGHLLLMASATLFALGAVLGMVHGVILGIAGRPEGTTPRQAWSAMVHGLLYLVPALLQGWLIAGWVAAMPIALNGGHIVAAVISATRGEPSGYWVTSSRLVGAQPAREQASNTPAASHLHIIRLVPDHPAVTRAVISFLALRGGMRPRHGTDGPGAASLGPSDLGTLARDDPLPTGAHVRLTPHPPRREGSRRRAGGQCHAR